MALNKHESYKSCPIPCPINMLKSKVAARNPSHQS